MPIAVAPIVPVPVPPALSSLPRPPVAPVKIPGRHTGARHGKAAVHYASLAHGRTAAQR